MTDYKMLGELGAISRSINNVARTLEANNGDREIVGILSKAIIIHGAFQILAAAIRTSGFCSSEQKIEILNLANNFVKSVSNE